MKNRNALILAGVIGGSVLTFCFCLGALIIVVMASAQVPSTVNDSSSSNPAQVATVVIETYNLKVINNSIFTICYLYMSRNTLNEWGPDQLNDNVLAPGDRFLLTNISPGRYDIRAVTCGGTEVERFGVGVYGDMEWTLDN